MGSVTVPLVFPDRDLDLTRGSLRTIQLWWTEEVSPSPALKGNLGLRLQLTRRRIRLDLGRRRRGLRLQRFEFGAQGLEFGLGLLQFGLGGDRGVLEPLSAHRRDHGSIDPGDFLQARGLDRALDDLSQGVGDFGGENDDTLALEVLSVFGFFL